MYRVLVKKDQYVLQHQAIWIEFLNYDNVSMFMFNLLLVYKYILLRHFLLFGRIFDATMQSHGNMIISNRKLLLKNF